MSSKLKDRIEKYQHSTDYVLLNRVPLVICVNGKNFSKITQLLDKPYCSVFTECMASTMLKLGIEIEGIIFAYQHNDEIVLISRNDQTNETNPWLDNKLQKICSVVSGIASLHFSEVSKKNNLNLTGSPLFTVQAFPVPTMTEAANTIIYKQQQNFHTSIQSACLYELLKKYDKNNIKEMLMGLTMDEKIDLLYQECQVDFNDYPLTFRRGIAAYKRPQISGETMKNKWYVNTELPIFTKEQSFLTNVFKMGHDIFRSDDF